MWDSGVTVAGIEIRVSLQSFFVWGACARERFVTSEDASEAVICAESWLPTCLEIVMALCGGSSFWTGHSRWWWDHSSAALVGSAELGCIEDDSRMYRLI